MYSRILVSLDGSKTSEQALLYIRCLAEGLKIPVELLSAIDTFGERSPCLDTFMDTAIRRNKQYLQRVAKTFPGVCVGWAVRSLLLGHSLGHVGYVDMVPGVNISRSFNKEIVVTKPKPFRFFPGAYCPTTITKEEEDACKIKRILCRIVASSSHIGRL